MIEARRYEPEEKYLRTRRRKNVKSYKKSGHTQTGALLTALLKFDQHSTSFIETARVNAVRFILASEDNASLREQLSISRATLK